MNKEDSKIKVNNANSKSFKICTFKNSVDNKKKSTKKKENTWARAYIRANYDELSMNRVSVTSNTLDSTLN